MNIGIRLHDTKPGTLRERLASAASQGFSCVQLAMGKAVPGFSMRNAPELLTSDLAAEVREELERAQMECAVLGCYLTLAQKSGDEADRIREIYRAHLRFAAQIGARCVGTETPPADGTEGAACQSEAYYRLFLRSIRPLVREAEELGILGCVNFEFIHAEDGSYYFMECNPRFSGGTGFSIAAGDHVVRKHLAAFGAVPEKVPEEDPETETQYGGASECWIARKYVEVITES